MENNEIEQNQAIEEEVKFESTDFGSAASNEPEKKKKKNIFGILFGGDILDNKLLSKNYGLLFKLWCQAGRWRSFLRKLWRKAE